MGKPLGIEQNTKKVQRRARKAVWGGRFPIARLRTNHASLVGVRHVASLVAYQRTLSFADLRNCQKLERAGYRVKGGKGDKGGAPTGELFSGSAGTYVGDGLHNAGKYHEYATNQSRGLCSIENQTPVGEPAGERTESTLFRLGKYNLIQKSCPHQLKLLLVPRMQVMIQRAGWGQRYGSGER